jgi:hypothetical protein
MGHLADYQGRSQASQRRPAPGQQAVGSGDLARLQLIGGGEQNRAERCGEGKSALSVATKMQLDPSLCLPKYEFEATG